MKTKRTLETPV